MRPPFPLDQRGPEQNDDAGSHNTHDYPKHNEPRRSGRLDWACQGWMYANKLQSLIS